MSQTSAVHLELQVFIDQIFANLENLMKAAGIGSEAYHHHHPEKRLVCC